MKILFVAMPNSIHSVRWINQLAEQGWDVHLFPSADGPLHPDFRNITAHTLTHLRPQGLDDSVRIKAMLPIWRGLRFFRAIAKLFWPGLMDPVRLCSRIIRSVQPDLIHSLEIQHAGYLVMEAKDRYLSGKLPPWMITNWGSDIYLFGRLASHEEKIKAVLAQCDYYSCECQRDVVLARSFGFKGKVFPMRTNTGGFDLAHLESLRLPGPTSSRRVIALKGYQHWAGRALTGIRALELCAEAIKSRGYVVEIYLASPEVSIAAELLQYNTGIPVRIIPYSSHDDMLGLHGRARVSIGLSISDAVSTSFLEALAMGSFPVQSNTSCAGEWIEDGKTGMLVHPEDPEGVAEAVRRAITDDGLVDAAAEKNALTVRENLDETSVKKQTVDMYHQVGELIKGTKSPLED